MSVRLTIATTCLVLALSGTTDQAPAAEPLVIDLWPGRPPGETGEPAADTIVPRKPNEDPPTLRLTNVTRPQITVYRPEPEAAAGAAILICPGGGFNHLAYDKEGLEIAQWLTTLGVTGVVLKYRCPTKQDPRTQHHKPLQDAQQALRLIRDHAEDWHVDPDKIGVCGFSAGGKVAALAATGATRESDLPAGRVRVRPAFMALIYPALSNEARGGLDVDGIQITAETPPAFIAYSWDDRHPSPGALHLALALKEAAVSCELHQYASGGHGYGMRPSELPVSGWPALLEDWLRSTGVLTK